MTRAMRLLIAIGLGLIAASTAFAQVRGPTPPPPGPGIGVFGPAIINIIPQVIDNQNNRDTPPPEPEPDPSPTQPPTRTITVETRNVPFPEPRPLLSLGRPALLDAQFEPQIIILLVDVSNGESAIANLAADYGLTLVESVPLDLIGFAMVKFAVPPDGSVAETIAEVAGDPRVVGQQPNYIFGIAQQSETPVDMRPLQYAPSKLQLVAAHQTTTGEGIIVGVIDTAVDAAHPELAGSVIEQADVLGGEVNSQGHGTAMSGLIVANAALEGVAPGVQIVAIRAFDSVAGGGVSSTSFALAKALDRMAASRARVMNLSFAGPRDPLILKVMDRLEELDFPVIAAAGNNGPEAEPVYPGAHRHAIAVTATDTGDAGFAFANLGMYVEVAAPGVDILSPQPGGDYDYETGTSAATAHVTGIVALMLARNPDLTVADIRLALAAASRDLGAPGRDEVFGVGLVDASLAVAAVANQ